MWFHPWNMEPQSPISMYLPPINVTPIAAKVLEILMSKRIDARAGGNDEKHLAGITGVSEMEHTYRS